MVSLSIILPCYKQDRYVEQCLESLLECSPPPDEIIASDNYCPNNSLEILQRYSKRLRIVRPPSHMEMTKHFNFLMKSSTSDFTSIVCADDFVSVDYVAVLKKLAEAYPSAVAVRAGWHNVDINSMITSSRKLYSLAFSRLRAYPYNYIESCGGSKNPLLSWAVNTKAFESIGFFDEDIDICDWSAFIALSKIGAFATACKCIAFYRADYRPSLEQMRTEKITRDAILIGERYVLPMMSSLPARYRPIAARKYLAKLTTIYQQYCTAQGILGRIPLNDIRRKVSSLENTLLHGICVK